MKEVFNSNNENSPEKLLELIDESKQLIDGALKNISPDWKTANHSPLIATQTTRELYNPEEENINSVNLQLNEGLHTSTNFSLSCFGDGAINENAPGYHLEVIEEDPVLEYSLIPEDSREQLEKLVQTYYHLDKSFLANHSAQIFIDSITNTFSTDNFIDLESAKIHTFIVNQDALEFLAKQHFEENYCTACASGNPVQIEDLYVDHNDEDSPTISLNVSPLSASYTQSKTSIFPMNTENMELTDEQKLVYNLENLLTNSPESAHLENLAEMIAYLSRVPSLNASREDLEAQAIKLINQSRDFN